MRTQIKSAGKLCTLGTITPDIDFHNCYFEGLRERTLSTGSRREFCWYERTKV